MLPCRIELEMEKNRKGSKREQAFQESKIFRLMWMAACREPAFAQKILSHVKSLYIFTKITHGLELFKPSISERLAVIFFVSRRLNVCMNSRRMYLFRSHAVGLNHTNKAFICSFMPQAYILGRKDFLFINKY